MSWQASGNGGGLSEAELSALIGIVDEDEDGCVSFAEFLRLMTLRLRAVGGKGPYIKDVRKIFGFLDPLPPPCPHFG